MHLGVGSRLVRRRLWALICWLVVMGEGSLVAPADKPSVASGATPLHGAPAPGAPNRDFSWSPSTLVSEPSKFLPHTSSRWPILAKKFGDAVGGVAEPKWLIPLRFFRLREQQNVIAAVDACTLPISSVP